ncbi:hypothetical protein OESDEN_13806 [Oesophagostomum dentatum]|uniref:Integrase zinc-binding domain-containing protein n=1 Tax=Oesophagostomum dentatum TaxID=61180 RepID=A0A0B1SM88_OESDE|nr:hypothetical protein OESDEN_13806 [Oesophagostomum dentatum]
MYEAVDDALLQELVLKQLHEGHPGMTRMKVLDRRYVNWTNINQDIEETVRNCCNFQEAAKMLFKVVLNSWGRHEALGTNSYRLYWTTI